MRTPLIDHGTTRGYDQHQKLDVPYCRPCRDAVARYENERRLEQLHGVHRTMPGLGSARRMQSLVALGYDYRTLGPMLGVSHDQARKLALGTHPVIRSSTAAAVDDLYRRLCMTPAPDTRVAKYARTVARRYGWVPPLAWDDIDHDLEPAAVEAADRDIHDVDDAVVERVLSGGPRPRRLTTGEATIIIRRCLARGMTSHEIRHLYQIKVERYIRLGDPEAAA